MEDDVNSYKACASFLIMEFSSNPVLASQKLQIRLQRPTITAEISFMLAVTKFFVPSFALSGAQPIPFQSLDLQLGSETFMADDDLWLCPETRLLADSISTDTFNYEGQVFLDNKRIIAQNTILAALRDTQGQGAISPS